MKILTALIFLFGFLAPHILNAGAPVLPEGFKLETFAIVPNARSLAPASEINTVFVGTRGPDIFAIIDTPLGSPLQKKVIHVARNLNVANGIAYRSPYLYVAEQYRLIRYKIDKTPTGLLKNPEVLYTKFPDKSWHGWRYITFDEHGALFVSLGVACNLCEPTGLEGTIVKFDPSTWQPEIYANGIRNSVGLAFHPQIKNLYFTDNGVDNMGDNLPSDELNVVQKAGQHFGYPYYGGGLTRTELFDAKKAQNSKAPLYQFQAHVAPLGLHFYQGNHFPKRYQGGLFVAQHGSWNRSTPVGYSISFFPSNHKGDLCTKEDFVKNWLDPEGGSTARPVDIKEWRDGRLLISDDQEDKVYIISYQTP